MKGETRYIIDSDGLRKAQDIINEIYFDLIALERFYSVLLKDGGSILEALKSRKKTILFKKLEQKEGVFT